MLVCSVVLSVVALASLGQLAFAQTYSPAYSQTTLEEQLQLAREKVQAVQANPHAGSGTPFLAADGMITAMLLSAAIFGTIFGIFVHLGRKAEATKKALR